MNLEQGVMDDTGSPEDQTPDPLRESSLNITSAGIYRRTSTLDSNRTSSTLDRTSSVQSSRSYQRGSGSASSSASYKRGTSSTLDRASTRLSLEESEPGTRGYYDRACSLGLDGDDKLGLLFHILEIEAQSVGFAIITAIATCHCLVCFCLPCPFPSTSGCSLTGRPCSPRAHISIVLPGLPIPYVSLNSPSPHATHNTPHHRAVIVPKAKKKQRRRWAF